jgi:hypothetical protein
MYKKLNDLGFVIGIFFILVALVLIIGNFVAVELASPLNLYTGLFFFVFGMLMAFLNRNNNK